MPATKQLALRVKGLVQGVFFRQSAREQALRLGLGGWVRNTADGDVELLVQGPSGAVDQFVSWCHHGPPHARVDAVEVLESSTPEEFHTFRVLHG